MEPLNMTMFPLLKNISGVQNHDNYSWLLTPSLNALDSMSATAVNPGASSEPASNEEALHMTRFIVQKICVPIVVFLGVVSNTLNIVVLTHRSMNTSTNVYLTVLALFDTLYLIFSMTLSLKHFPSVNEMSSYKYWTLYARVLTDMCSNVGVWQTITFTVERYIGVCHPIRGHVICTPQRARIITVIVSTIAVAVTIPEFFERIVIEETNSNNQTVVRIVYSEVGSSPSYQTGYHWFLTISFTFIPLGSLVFFNGLLIRAVVKANKIRRLMSKAPLRKTADKSGNEQQKITLMLISVAIVFLLCQFPGAILLLCHSYIPESRVTPTLKNDFRIAGNFTNLLNQINCSVNFFLYSLISTKFRRTFMQVFCCGRWTVVRQSNLSRTETCNLYRSNRRSSSGVTWCPTRSNAVSQTGRNAVRAFPYNDVENGSPTRLPVYVDLEEYAPFPVSDKKYPDRKDCKL